MTKIYFVSPMHPHHRMKYRENKNELTRIAKGVYIENPFQDRDLRAYSAFIAGYRFGTIRLMGQSAYKFMNGLSPVIHGKLYACSDSISGVRTKNLAGKVDIVLRGTTTSPFEGQSTMQECVLDQNPTIVLRIPSHSQIIWDSAHFPECACDSEVIQDCIKHISMHELKELTQDPECRKLIESTMDMQENESLNITQSMRVYLQDLPLGYLVFNGVTWNFKEVSDRAPIFKDREWDRFLKGLMPEGWTMASDGCMTPSDMMSPTIRAFFSTPRRFLSWSCVPHNLSAPLVVNTLEESISDMNNDQRVWSGKVDSSVKSPIEIRTALQKDGLIPRMSGVQPKAACFLKEGVLHMSGSQDPFTIIAKPDATVYDFHGSAVLEWMGMLCAERSGLKVPNFALIPGTSKENPSVFLSERFDIGKDKEYITAIDGLMLHKDMWAQAHGKYDITAEDLWKAMLQRGLPESENVEFFKRIALAWAIGDGDLHAKNFTVLFKGKVDEYQIIRDWSSELSPAYDSVCTKAYKSLNHNYMALHLRNADIPKGKIYGVEDIIKFGEKIKVPDPESIVTHIVEKSYEATQDAVAWIENGEIIKTKSYKKEIMPLVHEALHVIESKVEQDMSMHM